MLFLAVLLAMTDEGVRRLPVRWLFHLDPLTALGMALSSWTLTPGLLWALAIVGLTVLLLAFRIEAEAPFFGPRSTAVLQPNMTVCIDISLFGMPELHGARYETGYVITESGPQPLAPLAGTGPPAHTRAGR